MKKSHSGVGIPVPTLVLEAFALNRVRKSRLRFRIIKANDGNQDLSLEDLLCRTLAMMTNTEGD
ncbi:hypothetical protein PMIN01_08229 [Paraphaeosphaeria minitans]|uniref:Uncharacterized protein n=1 Tax=Paraphaeosphaeria minitans TaxID=565426 RepID=A0A9P6GG82_9PLEO|nr:hypothetical protein PMIN01_08163 [Paraphaeosphaeria minitans]KAF9733886.1 hypothetical protein PMIN01_08229 [Paraphaeosphaeria minitans]